MVHGFDWGVKKTPFFRVFEKPKMSPPRGGEKCPPGGPLFRPPKRGPKRPPKGPPNDPLFTPIEAIGVPIQQPQTPIATVASEESEVYNASSLPLP